MSIVALRSWFTTLAVLACVAACASGGPAGATPRPTPSEMPSMTAGTKCDPADYQARPEADRRAIDAAYSAEERMEEIRVVLHAPKPLVRERVLAAMLACDIPVSQSSDDVIEAGYGQETSLIARYALTTHANVVALDDSTTLVRLSGRETSKLGNALHPNVDTRPIANKNHGRSGAAWVQLRNVAKQLRADPELNADFSKSTKLGLVYTR